MKQITETNNFILSMGTTTQIPIVYTQSPQLSIEKNGKIQQFDERYSNGLDIIFQCPHCKDYIGKGKTSSEKEDCTKIYCFNCKKHIEYGFSLNSQKEILWHKPENKSQRVEFEKLMNEELKKNIKII